jgi:hypothetical protein
MNRNSKHCRSMTQLPFSKVLDDRLANNLSQKHEINYALNYDDKNSKLLKAIYATQKRKFKIIEEKKKNEKKEMGTFVQDNKDFIKSYKKLEQFKLMRSKSQKDIGTFETAFHDTLVQYFFKGYNVQQLKGKLDVFDTCPLLAHKNDLPNYFKTLDMDHLKKNNDLEYLFKLETLTAVGLSDEDRRILAERERILRQFGKKSRNRALYKSVAEMEEQNKALKKEIKMVKQTMNIIDTADDDNYIVKKEDNSMLNNSNMQSLRTNYRTITKKGKALSSSICNSVKKSCSDISTQHHSMIKVANKSGFTNTNNKSSLNVSQVSTFQPPDIKRNSYNHSKTKQIMVEDIVDVQADKNRTPDIKFIKRSTDIKRAISPVKQPTRLFSFGTKKSRRTHFNEENLANLLPLSKTNLRKNQKEITSLDFNKQYTYYKERENVLEGIVDDINRNTVGGKMGLQLIKRKVQLYNHQYLGYEDKTIDNLFSSKVEPISLWKQNNDIIEKINTMNIPDMMKKKLNGINVEDDKRMKQLIQLDGIISRLNIEMAKKINPP